MKVKFYKNLILYAPDVNTTFKGKHLLHYCIKHNSNKALYLLENTCVLFDAETLAIACNHSDGRFQVTEFLPAIRSGKTNYIWYLLRHHGKSSYCKHHH